MAVWGGLTNSCERREAKRKGEKARYKHLNEEFQRIARRDKKAFFSNQCKEIEENNRMGKTRDLFKKIRDTKGTFTSESVTTVHRAPNISKLSKTKMYFNSFYSSLPVNSGENLYKCLELARTMMFRDCVS